MNTFTKVLRKANVSFFQQKILMHPAIGNQYRTYYSIIMNGKNQYIGTKSIFSYKKYKINKKKDTIRTVHTGTEKNNIDAIIRAYTQECNEIWQCESGHDDKINKLVEKWYIDADVLWIRPSGNPLTPAIWSEMVGSGDIKFESSKIVSFDSFRLIAGGNVAVVTLTQHDKFTYKGTANNDICKFTFVLEKIEDNWKFAHGHRATGQAPK